MAKAYAFIVNNQAQAFTASSGTVNPGSGIHGFGSIGCGNRCKYIIEAQSSGINLNASGYYDVVISANVTNSEAGNVTLTLLQDGQTVGSWTEAIAAASDPATITFPAGIKVNCNSTLTLQVSSSAGTPTVNSVYSTVEKM